MRHHETAGKGQARKSAYSRRRFLRSSRFTQYHSVLKNILLRSTHPTRTSKERREVNIGFVGLGVMGRNIVPRLQAAGHDVIGWNRSRDKAQSLIDAGMAFADTPR